MTLKNLSNHELDELRIDYSSGTPEVYCFAEVMREFYEVTQPFPAHQILLLRKFNVYLFHTFRILSRIEFL